MVSPPGHVAQPRPQQTDITTVPAPWQSLHSGGAGLGCGVADAMAIETAC